MCLGLCLPETLNPYVYIYDFIETRSTLHTQEPAAPISSKRH